MGADDVIARLIPLMKSAGITRVANITGLDEVGIPVVVVTRPSSRSLSVSQGKGVTLLQAKLSGIMESLEQFHAERVELPLTLSTLAELSRTQGVADIEQLPRTSRAFDQHTRILWTRATDLLRGDPVYVPFELVHLDFTLPLPEGSGYFLLGSNGLASGEDFTCAAAHGIWELIERDAMALFFERSPEQQSRRRVALRSVVDPCCASLLKRLSAAGLAVAIWDMTSDLNVAAFMCSIGERELDPFRRIGLARGYGCHPDSATALRRALTEAAQSRLTRIAGSRDDLRPLQVESIRSAESIERHRAHAAQEEFAVLRATDVPSTSHESTKEALDWTLERLAQAGFAQILCVALTPRDYPISVVRSIIAGLEGVPDSAGYVPGRRVQAIRRAR
jgi:ribosomal protein S12 methylthiotransferase accessory factor